MHEDPGRRFFGGLFAFLTAAILLAAIPVVFREPATTFYRTVDIALHAYQLSIADSVSVQDVRLSFPVFGGFPEGLLFGSYNYFPYRINTCRDLLSGVTLVRITGDVDNFHAGPVENRSGLTVTALKRNNDLYILFGESSESWPQRLFSHLSKDG